MKTKSSTDDKKRQSVWALVRFYFSVYRRFIGRRVYLVFLLTAGVAFAEGFGISLILPLLEAADAGDTGSEVSAPTKALMVFLDTVGIGDSIIALLLFIGVIFIAKGLLLFGESGYLAYLKSRLMVEIKGKLFSFYSTMDYGYYTSRNTGHFINVINAQIALLIQSFGNFKQYLSAIIMTVAYFAVAMVLAWKFALMALVLGVVTLFLFRALNDFVKNLSRQAAKEESNLNKFLVQSLQGFKYLASTSQMKFLKGGVFDSIKKLADFQYKKGLAAAFTSAIKEPISVLFVLGVIIIQIVVFNAPIAPIFVAIILFHRGMQQLVGIQSKWQSTLDRVGALEMVVEEFELAKNLQEPNGSIKIPALRSSVELRNVDFAYKEEDGNVLKNLNVEIPVNKTVAFVGESGAGKSTLIDMLTLMLRPQKGEILVDGVTGSDIERSSWRTQIGYVSQETVMFDDTIANNINLWNGDYENDPKVRERVHAAAEKAFALNFIEELPEGFLTEVGDRGVRLSGGQRQRIFIARELFKNPNLLILDEATSALDSDSEAYIQRSIDELKGSVTVVIIAHRLSTIRNSDYIYVMSHGEIVEEGTYDALTHLEDGRFREMVELQSL